MLSTIINMQDRSILNRMVKQMHENMLNSAAVKYQDTAEFSTVCIVGTREKQRTVEVQIKYMNRTRRGTKMIQLNDALHRTCP